MMVTPELSRPMTVETLRRTAPGLAITATPAECAALARRFGLIAIDRLTARIDLSAADDGLRVRGTLDAAVTQRCIATDAPVAATIATPIDIRCVPIARLEVSEAEAEVELSDVDLDVVGYDGRSIDLGELVADSLALALDPWPRAKDADRVLRAHGVLSEDEVHGAAFSGLAALRDAMQAKDAS